MGDVVSAGRGVLPSQEIQALVGAGHVRADVQIEDRQIQPASLDLRLGREAYRLRASFLPGVGSTVESRLSDLSMVPIDLSRPTVFERRCVYLVRLREELRLPTYLSARANPKSTTGRLDVFTRLISDHGTEFDRVTKRYEGPLYVEVVPRTFSIIVTVGLSLSQLRFIRGRPLSSDTDLQRLARRERLVYGDDAKPGEAVINRGLNLSVSLRGDRETGVVAYRGRRDAPLVDLQKVGFYDAREFWDVIRCCPGDRLILHPGDFYILGSCERVSVPPEYAAEMTPIDPSVGEFRTHYAGFFDPGFGYGDKDINGTRAVMEVRAHDVPFAIEHGQMVGRLDYERMLGVPDRIYGAAIGSAYQRQELALSKQFRRAAPAAQE
jgi:dCTP deaminase